MHNSCYVQRISRCVEAARELAPLVRFPSRRRVVFLVGRVLRNAFALVMRRVVRKSGHMHEPNVARPKRRLYY